MKEYLEKIRTYSNRPCIIHKDVVYTFEQLLESVDSYGQYLLKERIDEGAIVSLRADYSFDTIALMLALARNRNIIVPITDLPKDEVDIRVEESNSAVLLTLNHNELSLERLPTRPVHEMVAALRGRNKSGLILFSSGSTGHPKAMMHDFDILVSSYVNRRGKELIFLVFLLFDHIGGINTLLNCLSIGATMVIPDTRNPEGICSLIDQYKVNVLPSSPTFLNLLLMVLKEKSYDLSSLKLITYGTEPMPESLLFRLRQNFPSVKFLQTFGTSETGIARTSSQSSSSTLMRIEKGETDYKVVNGELWLRSKTQILGYLNHSMERFSEDGWFMTGDLVEETEEGFVRILGRINEVINVGGSKVLPQEVESLVMEIDGIVDCTAYPIPNGITGQTVGLSVSTDIKDDRLIKRLIRSHCRAHLDAFKVPTKIEIVDRVEFSRRYKKVRVSSKEDKVS